jgi:hypothetical protein
MNSHNMVFDSRKLQMKLHILPCSDHTHFNASWLTIFMKITAVFATIKQHKYGKWYNADINRFTSLTHSSKKGPHDEN